MDVVDWSISVIFEVDAGKPICVSDRQNMGDGRIDWLVRPGYSRQLSAINGHTKFHRVDVRNKFGACIPIGANKDDERHEGGEDENYLNIDRNDAPDPRP
jgi:hypothetical protein